MQDELLAIIENYQSNGYFTYGNIPPKKLQNAKQCFPVDPTDTVLALVDCTVMGSCKTGLAIGLKGIYWKNDWTTESNDAFLSWEDLTSPECFLSKSGYDVEFTPGNRLNMSGAGMKKDLLINLLSQLIHLYEQLSGGPVVNATAQAVLDQHVVQDISPTVAPPVSAAQIEAPRSNEVNHALYESLLPKLIAICICADDVIEDSEIETASLLIEHDDQISDASEALASLSENIDMLMTQKQKSSALFKLKANGIIAQVSKLSVADCERIKIVLEGLLDSIDDGDKGITADLLKMVDSKMVTV